MRGCPPGTSRRRADGRVGDTLRVAIPTVAEWPA